MLRGSPKITQIETFLNQVINEKFMLQQDSKNGENKKALDDLRDLKRNLMNDLFTSKEKSKSQLKKLSDNDVCTNFFEKFVTNTYTLSEDQMNNLVKEKQELMKRLFEAKEKNYFLSTEFTEQKIKNMDMRKACRSSMNRTSEQNKKTKENVSNNIMSQNKVFQINENEYRKKKYYIFIWKHITAFSILSLLTLLFMKTEYISSRTAFSLITMYLIFLLIILVINYYYFNRRNFIYFHRFNWKNLTPKVAEQQCP